ncbi:MAG: fructose-1,6-bisphosphatase [SAR202 cluster bacterium]|nr:fructose-1,6-bisphosphatase [SAR202 cluster bacterium]
MTSPSSHLTLKEFCNSHYKGSAKHDGLEAVIDGIASGARDLEGQIRNGNLLGMLGTTGDVNVQGEIVQQLDAISSDTFVKKFQESGRVAMVGCEEIEHPVTFGDSEQHKYIVLMDPLDGSSNIDVAVSIGSIFGIWKRESSKSLNAESLLMPGSKQIGSAYVVYGSCTVLVVATEGSVNEFTMNPKDGDFYLTSANIMYPDKTPYYSVNDGNTAKWVDGIVKAVDQLRDGRSQRYIGSLVADFHRNIIKGGVFLYTADTKNTIGRLRLMYEANPLGYVSVQAGGAVSNGVENILNIQPVELHQRVPLIIGNKTLVNQIIETIKVT